MTVAIVELACLLQVAVSDAPRLADERIVLETRYGDLVLALYPDVAPKHVEHVLNLARLGAYDTTHLYRVEDDFVIQISEIEDRVRPLTPDQAAANRTVPAEFSALKHEAGILSMARWEDPDSATSSFSILLGEAPHLDGQYTVFGRLESGGSVVNRILGAPREGTQPLGRLGVTARVFANAEVYYASQPFDPPTGMGEPIREPLAPKDRMALAVPGAVAWMLLAMVGISVVGFAGYRWLGRERLLSLLMLEGLIGGFALFVIATPLGGSHPWIAPLVFVGLLGLFKFMNRFESV